MYLKKIELHGFKSFADKVNIEFQPGITGIVGPNGCGKSNISDAVRWVLGEQSVKSLRGSNMADVIFAGSQDRRAQNLAEVTLIFDNSDRMLNYDYNEVRSMMTWHLHQAKEYPKSQYLEFLFPTVCKTPLHIQNPSPYVHYFSWHRFQSLEYFYHLPQYR